MKTMIKKGTSADIKMLQEISIETYTDTFGAQNTAENMAAYLNSAFTLEGLAEEMGNEGTSFYFIYFDEQLAGYLKLNVGDAQTESVAESALEVERIYILPSFKRKGLGNQLIETAIEKAKAQNKKNIWLGVWEENEPALNFYEKMGFVQFSKHSFFMGDDEQTDLIMVKSLGE
ncbi:GNAT family N-acetyltransferase [Enterococcus sp. BWM-S5]|uniref:GNAT family N-acetyltransferase n=1 Tax=Enterococcus larvae TaxID=2794352 RepID=A0ABS4CGJ0_9ENTE|nr:GNAT family N-acetyltransferase [Enterococcus larvae]MBP1045735.1 GNAT family N-acetyltransferase [Enterococcus larvae]